MLSYYDGSLSKALLEIYPDIGLQKSQFKFTSMFPGIAINKDIITIINIILLDETWKDPNNRKQFFIEFANQNNFDYGVPENWYNISQSSILARKVH